jgi:hypothetical protein
MVTRQHKGATTTATGIGWARARGQLSLEKHAQASTEANRDSHSSQRLSAIATSGRRSWRFGERSPDLWALQEKAEDDMWAGWCAWAHMAAM